MYQLPATPNPGSPPAPAVWYRQTVDYLRALAGRVSALEARVARVPVVRRTFPEALAYDIVVSSEVPTSGEIATAIVGAYTYAGRSPLPDDIVILSVSSVPKFLVRIRANSGPGPVTGIFAVAVTISGTDYRAYLTQMGEY